MAISQETNNGAPVIISKVPVLIIGAGPCGLLQAYLLARLNVRSLVIEKHAKRLAAPKAHALSPRSLEICRQFCIDTAQVRSTGTPRGEASWVNFVVNLSEGYIGRIPYERMDAAVLNDTPEMLHNVPQPDFEQILATQIAKRPDLTELKRGLSFVSVQQNDQELTTIVEDHISKERMEIKSRFVIACDGANSQVRRSLGIESEGESSVDTMMSIHFHADLRPVVKSKVGMLHWIMNPIASGVIIAYDLGGNQVFLCNFDPKVQPVETWSEELCRQALRAAIGQDVPMQVQSWRPWVLNRKVAEQYRVGNVFLAGDAAHSFPPTGGLGLNSGLADVHNLAYKIAAIYQGWANESIFKTYESERRPVAIRNSAQSLKNGQKILVLVKVLAEALSNGLENCDQASKASDDSVQEAIADQQEHFDNLGLHIGYTYGGDVLSGSASDYIPRCVAGARLPHAWIEILRPSVVDHISPIDNSYIREWTSDEIKKRRWSTLDLCAIDSVTTIQSNSSFALSRAQKLEQLIANDQVLGPVSTRKRLVRFVALGTDFELLPYGHSEMLKKILRADTAADGVILVNPDQHILFVADRSISPEDIVRELRKYFFDDE